MKYGSCRGAAGGDGEASVISLRYGEAELANSKESDG